MKRLELVGLKTCPHCRQAIAYLMTQDGEKTFGIALDGTKTRELSRQDLADEKFLTDLLMQLLASSPYVAREVVLDWKEDGFLTARLDLTTGIFSCSPQEAIALVAAAEIPFYATERVFQHIRLFHPADEQGGSADLIQPKLKPVLH